MEIKLYTRKEANEIIKRYPDRKLHTKTVVVDIVKNEGKSLYEAYSEKRMFYIVETVWLPGLGFEILFKENA